MAVFTQGTQLFCMNPDDPSPAVLKVMNVKNLNPGGSPADQIETTSLEDNVRSYLPGLRTPGQASLTLDFDPAKDSHVKIHAFSQDNPPPTLVWAIGWSDGADVPTINANKDGFTYPKTRTFTEFRAYVSDCPFDFQQNTVVTTSVSLQRSGGERMIRKGG